MLTIFDVANYFLAKTDLDTEDVITPLKLQKICYYAQSWSLALTEERLFNANFEAWAHGPVNPELYHEYKGYRATPIPAPTDFDSSIVTKEQMTLLDDVWDVYGKYSAKHLENLTHQEDPWISAREGYEDGEYCTVPLDEELMKQFYQGLIADGEE